jgi:4-hydroxybenzoate polyprenyltransferase
LGVLSNIYERLLGRIQYKFSLIFGSIYVIIASGTIPSNIIIYLLLSLLTATGIAALGYLLNDWKDYEYDIINNKSNLLRNMNSAQRLLLVAFSIILTIFPWFYLPFTVFSLLLLAGELSLFFMYAFPPFRLKERGLWGVISDSIYAQLLPCLFALYTFAQIVVVDIRFSYLLLIYISWLLLVGIRNILVHQIYDYHHDIATSNNTYVVNKGIQPVAKFYLQIGFSIEILFFLYLIYNIPNTHHYLLVIYLIYLFILMIINKSIVRDDIFGFIHKRVLNEFYEIFLPLLLTVFFTLKNLNFLPILVFNTVIFLPLYKNYILNFIRKYK